MSSYIDNPDYTVKTSSTDTQASTLNNKLTAGIGITLTEQAGTVGKTIKIESLNILYSGIIRIDTINNVCLELTEAIYTDIDCEGTNFSGDDIIQCTLMQQDGSVCRDFYITARMSYDDNLGRYVARIWLWGSLSWDRYEIFVTIFRNTGCQA